MTDYPTPRLLVNQEFRDTELLGKAVGWDVDFRQIDHGLLCARALLLGHPGIAVLRVDFDRSFHQIGHPPPGFLTFGLPDKESGVLRWRGVESPPGALINFNYEKKLDCVSPAPFGGFVLSFSEEVLKGTSEKLALDPSLINDISSHRFWVPGGGEHEQLRQILRALRKVAQDDGDNGLGLWKDVFNFDLAASIVRILVKASSTPKVAGPAFRSAAMNRAIGILGDYNQY